MLLRLNKKKIFFVTPLGLTYVFGNVRKWIVIRGKYLLFFYSSFDFYIILYYIKKKSERATQEQLEFYVKFCRDHPQLLAGKNSAIVPNCVQDLWQELANGLNALRGPTRTVPKWKENMGVWKCALRTRARNIIMSKRVTGGGPCKKDLSDFETLALNTFGTAAVDGVSNIPTYGFALQNTSTSVSEEESLSHSLNAILEDIDCSGFENPISPGSSMPPSSLPATSVSVTPSPVSSMPPSPSPVSSMPPSPLPATSTPPSPLPASNKLKRDTLLQSLSDSLQQRKEDEAKRQERELKIMEAITAMSSALTALTQEIAKLKENKN